MVGGSETQIFLSPRWKEVGFVESGHGEQAMHDKGVTVALLRKHNAPNIATILTQCQTFAGTHTIVVHQFEVPYGWARHTK